MCHEFFCYIEYIEVLITTLLRYMNKIPVGGNENVYPNIMAENTFDASQRESVRGLIT